jgi:hypothetical protein
MDVLTEAFDKAKQQEQDAIDTLLQQIRASRKERFTGDLSLSIAMRDGGIMGKKVTKTITVK